MRVEIRLLLVFIVGIAIIGGLFFAAPNWDLPYWGFTEPSDRFLEIPLWRCFLTFVAMTVGILFGVINNRLKTGSRVHVFRELKIGLQSSEFVRAMLVSPIVFAAIYALARREPDPFASLLLSFQNGFFWKEIFHKAANPD